MICPKCRKTETTSTRCEYCNLDINTEEFIYYCNIYESEMRNEITNLKYKLLRKTTKMKKLIKNINKFREKLFQLGYRTELV